MKKLVITEPGNTVYGYATNDSSAVGGAERYQWLLARALAAHGWYVTVGVRGVLAHGARQKFDGVEFVGIGEGQILSAWYNFLRSEQPAWWFWAAAYHLWGAAVEIAKLLKVRTIFSSQFDSDVTPSTALSWRRSWWPLYAWGLFRTDKIFVQHSQQLSRLRPALRSRASVLPGIVLQNGRNVPHSSRTPYVAWVGMLRQPKRPDLLVKIAQELPNIPFVVCGGSSRHRTPEDYSDRIIEEMHRLPNIEFRGQVSPNEAVQVIGGAALLLCTSDGEGFPSTFLEAWSQGTPVVSLRIDPDRVIERLGLGVVSGTIENAMTDIPALIESAERRDEFAEHGREYVGGVHSEAAVVDVFDRAIREIDY